MSVMILDALLPPPPSHWDNSRECKVHKKIANCIARAIEPAGHAFMGRARRHRHKRTLSEDIMIEEALREANAGEGDDEEEEEETPKLLKSDPSKWKDQDHYAVLGLSRLRYRATDDDIKRAYRRKVLKHHPDKKAAATGKTNDDSFFKCIQKAWEVISDNKRRREWDSCDPQFDDSIPGPKLKGDFFDVYGPVFEKESRFSKKHPVPGLGDMNSDRESVENFYTFWFNFESWRTFERMDEEEADGAEGRDEKRYLDRKNKAARAKLKKEDNARLNKLVDQAFSLDPRIRKFKEEEKAAKEAKKREKELAARAGEIEAAKKAEEERLAREAIEAEEKSRQQAEKAKREAHKNAVRNQKKNIRRMLRDNNNFLAEDATDDNVVSQLARLEFILEHSELPELESFRTRLEEALPSGVDGLILVFDEEHMAAEERAAAEKNQEASGTATPQLIQEDGAAQVEWSPKEITILIKAVKQFPGGASARWEKIAEYVMEHGGQDGETSEEKAQRTRTPKDCIQQSKKMQNAASADRARLQATAAKPVAKVEIKDAPTERIEPVKDTGAKDKAATASTSATPAAPTTTMAAPPNPNWNTEQQLALEQMLRKYPASNFSSNPSARWDTIAGEIPGKTPKDIKNRVKELADMIKKKNKK